MSALPRPELGDIEAFIEIWGLPTSEDRLERRLASSIDELRAYHDAVVPRLPEIIEYLNQFPLAELSPQDQKLAWTALGVCEVDNAVNKWRKPVLETGIDIRRMVPKTGFYDQVKA